MKTCLMQNQISLVDTLENMQLECGNVLLKMGSYIKVVEQNAIYFLILISCIGLMDGCAKYQIQ
jgi:hypothetical protein